MTTEILHGAGDFDGLSPFSSRFRGLLNEVARLCAEYQRLSPQIVHRLGMMVPIPPLPGSSTVAIARITAVHAGGAGSLPTYDASSVLGPALTVTSAAPINRVLGDSQVVAARVDDTCLLVRKAVDENTPPRTELIILTEPGDFGSCPPSGLTDAPALFNPFSPGLGGDGGGGIGGGLDNQSGFENPQQLLDFLLARIVSGQAIWGAITGTLANQSDLKTALDGKAAVNHASTHSQGSPDEVTLAIAQITGLVAALAAKEATANKNAANGYVGLNGFSKINSGSYQVYGSSANTACEGNDSRLSDSRAPTGSAGGDLAGTYPNPTIKTSVALTTPTLTRPVAAVVHRAGGLRTLSGRSFNGTTDIAKFATTPCLGSPMTFSVQACWSAAPGALNRLLYIGDSAGSKFISLYYNTSDGNLYYLRTDGSNTTFASKALTIVVNTVYSIVCVTSASNADQLYINGSAGSAGSTSVSALTGTILTCLGAAWFGSVGNPFGGQLYEPALWTSALGSNAIADLAAGCHPSFISGAMLI